MLSACGGGGSSSSDAAPPPAGSSPPPPTSTDTTAPVISNRSPADRSTGVSVTAPIVVEFSESLDASSVQDQSLMVMEQAVPVAGTAVYDDATKSLAFTPESALAPDTVYEVSVASTLQDAAGNAFLGDSWFFTTGGPYNLGPTSQIVIDQCMDDGDKLMLTLVNNARAVARTCDTQSIPAQEALAWNCLLDEAALGHSTSMAENDFHAHVSPVDGSDPGDRIRAAGYVPQTWGENIAAGYDTAESVMQGWLDSPGHCANIMHSGFSELGAASAEDAASTYGIYWTQKFGHPQN